MDLFEDPVVWLSADQTAPPAGSWLYHMVNEDSRYTLAQEQLHDRRTIRIFCLYCIAFCILPV